MHPTTFTIFSIHLGAMLAVIAACGFDSWFRRSRPSWGATLYFLVTVVVALLGSGWLEAAFGWSAGSAAAGVVATAYPVLGVVAALMGMMGVRRWLGFPWRGHLLDQSLLKARTVIVVGLAAVLMLALAPWFSPVTWARGANWSSAVAGALAIVALGMSAHVCWHMKRLGDRLSSWMVAATWMTVPGVLIMATFRATGIEWSPWVWGIAVALHAAAMLATAVAAMLQSFMRNDRERASNSAANHDDLKRVPSGDQLLVVMGAKFDRMHAMGSTPAVLLVNVFNHDAVVNSKGSSAADQVTLATLARMRTVLNPNDVVGRYFDSCFVVLISAQVDSHYLREVSMRLSASVRRDLALRGMIAQENDNETVALDLGVGVCWSDRVTTLSEAMHQAGMAASAAREHPSKAYVVIYPDHPPLPVESVLGGDASKPGV